MTHKQIKDDAADAFSVWLDTLDKVRIMKRKKLIKDYEDFLDWVQNTMDFDASVIKWDKYKKKRKELKQKYLGDIPLEKEKEGMKNGKKL